MTEIAYQVRCLGCLREQYGPAVHDFSHGSVSCACGFTPTPMTWDEYVEALRLARLKASDDE